MKKNSKSILAVDKGSVFYHDMKQDELYLVSCEDNPYGYDCAQLAKFNNGTVRVSFFNQFIDTILESIFLTFSTLQLINIYSEEVYPTKNLTLSQIVDFAIDTKYVIDIN